MPEKLKAIGMSLIFLDSRQIPRLPHTGLLMEY